MNPEQFSEQCPKNPIPGKDGHEWVFGGKCVFCECQMPRWLVEQQIDDEIERFQRYAAIKPERP